MSKNAVDQELKQSAARKHCGGTKIENGEQNAKVMAVGLLANSQDAKVRQNNTREEQLEIDVFISACVARNESTFQK